MTHQDIYVASWFKPLPLEITEAMSVVPHTKVQLQDYEKKLRSN